MWLEDTVKKDYPTFAQWLGDIFKIRPTIQVHVFDSPSYLSSIGAEAILTMCCDNQPDNDVLDSIMSFFNKFYSNGKQNLFLGPGDILSSEKDPPAKMIYAVINIGCHYGAACLDVEGRVFSHGQSNSWSRPFPHELDKLKRLITSEGDWRSGTLVVPYDSEGNNSGILAAVAIEQMVNLHTNWPDNASAYHERIRYLRLVSGHAKVEYITQSTCLRVCVSVGMISLLFHVTNTSPID